MKQYMCYRRDTKEKSRIFTRFDLASDWAVELLRAKANACTVTWHIMRREAIPSAESISFTAWKPVARVYTNRYEIMGTGPNVRGVPWPCSTPETD